MNAIVIEDQILFRELIVSVLRNDFDLNVLGEYDDGETGMEACLDDSPDLLVLDIKIKKLGGLTVFNHLKDRVPDMNIILVSAHFTPEIVKSSVEHGVNGLVTNNSSIESPQGAIGKSSKERYTIARKLTTYSANLSPTRTTTTV